MAKQVYLLQVEGINLNHSVFDTSDLSTMRGGSMALLKAVKLDVPKWIEEIIACWQDEGGSKKYTNFETISTGASVGIFQVITQGDREAMEAIKSRVLQKLAEHPLYGHLSFAVAYAQVLKSQDQKGKNGSKNSSSDFIQAQEKVTALIRWQQMQMPSCSLKGFDTETQFVCEVDGVRPATHIQWLPNRQRRDVSESVHARREEGKKSKQNFVENILGSNLSAFKFDRFARSFDEISRAAPARDYGNLNGKIALLYADGNSFSKIRNRVVTEAKVLTAFDDKVQAARLEFLQDLCHQIDSNPDWVVEVPDKNGVIEKVARFELLMWGGDEMTLVAPAWLGFELANSLFSQLGKKGHNEFEGNKLTHSAGLIFCHHNAPIRKINQIAYELVSAQKGLQNKDPSDSFAYLTLESFDTVGESLDSFWTSFLPRHLQQGKVSEDQNALGIGNWCIKNPVLTLGPIKDCFALVKPTIARRQVFIAAQNLFYQDTDNLYERSHRVWDEFIFACKRFAGTEQSMAALKILCEIFSTQVEGGQVVNLTPIHLALLWDYVACKSEVEDQKLTQKDFAA